MDRNSTLELAILDLERRIARLELISRVSVPDRPVESGTPPRTRPETSIDGDVQRQAAPPPPLNQAAPTSIQPKVARSHQEPRATPTDLPPRLTDLERLVGVKVFAIAGALIVIAGAAFFFKLAWDQGWLGRLPDTWKATLGALFGAAMLGAGDIVRRRFGSLAGTGLNAAGLGVLYATAYASHQTLDLISRPTAFTLLALTSITAFFIAMRSRSVAIACVAMIGGYAAPFLLSNSQLPPVGFLPAYWMALAITGVGLAAAKIDVFAPARAMAWWFTLVLGAGWTAWRGDQYPLVGAVFFGAFWTLTHVELVLRARRQTIGNGDAGAHSTVAKNLRGVMTSLTTTAWAVGLSIIALRTSTLTHLDWLAPAAGFAATAHLAIVLAGSLHMLRDLPRNELERLGATFAASAGALAALTIALALAGWAQAASWFALAIAAAIGARWMRAKSLIVYAMIVAILGTARLVPLQWWSAAPVLAFEGLILTKWSVLVGVASAVWIALGALSRFGRDDRDISLQWLAIVLGVALLYVIPAHQDATWMALTVLWLSISANVWLVERLIRFQDLHRLAFAGVLASAGAWIAAQSQAHWLHAQDVLVLNASFVLALLIAALGFATASTEWRRPRRAHSFAIPVAFLAAPAIWTFGITTLEVMRIAERAFADPTAQRAVVSLWWAVGALGLFVSGVALRNATARRIGLAVLSIAGAKTALYDLVGVGASWRVATFLIVGAIMLSVAVFYARAVRRASAAR